MAGWLGKAIVTILFVSYSTTIKHRCDAPFNNCNSYHQYRHMQKLLFSFILLIATNASHAQSPVGKWKRISSITENANGTKTDMQKSLHEAMPCTANTAYSFLAGGKMTSTADGCPASFKKTMEQYNDKSKWAAAGNKITVSIADNTLPPAAYIISYKGNYMTWVFKYADNPKTPNPTNAKSLTLIYQKI